MIAPTLRAARALDPVVLNPSQPAPVVRPALPGDERAIAALLAPEIAAGTVLPREIYAADFLVAEVDGRLVGAVALSPWTAEVIELGALVAGLRGRGIGGALTRAAVDRAGELGYHAVVALTGAPGFFRRAGFLPIQRTPWASARSLGASDAEPQIGGVPLGDAIAKKSTRCAACPRLAGCDQALLAIPAARRRAAA